MRIQANMDNAFQAQFALTEGEAHVIAAAMRYTDEHCTARTEGVRELEKRLLKFIDTHWNHDKMDTPLTQKESN